MNKKLKKKIAIIAGRDPKILDDTDGGSVFLEYLIKELLNKNYFVDVFTPLGVTGGLYKKSKAENQSKNKNFSQSNLNFNYIFLKRENLPIKKDIDYFLRRIDRSKEIAEFFKKKQLFDYDMVYVLHLANAFFLIKNRLLPLKKTIFFPMMTSAHYKLFSKVPNSYTDWEQKTLNRAEYICSPSDNEIKSIVSSFRIREEKLFKIHRGFDENHFPAKERFSINIAKPIILFSANGIRPQKDHLFMVPLVKYLLEEGLKVQVRLIGNSGQSHNPVYNNYTKEFWRNVRLNSLENEFISYGVVPREKMVSIMNSSDIAIYPSKSETFGKSALESVVSGLPTVVCSDVPAFSEFIEHEITGSIVNRNTKDYAKEIIKLCKNPDYYHSVSQNGIALRPKFTWNKVINNLLEAQKKKRICLKFMLN